MKKLTLIFLILFESIILSAQNTFPWPTVGNIGIGTPTPAFPLDVVGTINATQVSTSNSGVHVGSGLLNPYIDINNSTLSSFPSISMGINPLSSGNIYFNGNDFYLSSNNNFLGATFSHINLNTSGAIYLGNNLGDALVINPNRLVGIGNINSSVRFSVNEPTASYVGTFINTYSNTGLWVRRDNSGTNDALTLYATNPSFTKPYYNNLFTDMQYSIVGDNGLTPSAHTGGGFFHGSNIGVNAFCDNSFSAGDVIGVLSKVENPSTPIANGYAFQGSVTANNSYGINLASTGNDLSYGGLFNSRANNSAIGLLLNATSSYTTPGGYSMAWGVDAKAYSKSTSFGLKGYAQITTGGDPIPNSQSWGTYGEALNASDNVGAFGIAYDGNTSNKGVWGKANNSISGTHNTGVYGEVTSTVYNLSTYNIGVIGLSNASFPWTPIFNDWGGYFRSVYGGLYCEATNTSSSLFSTGIYAKGYSTLLGTYAGYFDGDVFTTTTYYPSDEKLKENIIPVTNAIDIINQLAPKTYYFKKDLISKGYNLPSNKKYGLIAQNLQEVLPDLVKKSIIFGSKDSTGNFINENIDILSVDYVSLIPVLIGGIQEQQTQIHAKDSTINILVNQIKNIQDILSKNGLNSNLNSSNSNPINNIILNQNNPNPFKDNASISYTIPVDAGVFSATIYIYDLSGKQVKKFDIQPNMGVGSVQIQSGDLQPGIYIYSMICDNKIIDTKRMIIKD